VLTEGGGLSSLRLLCLDPETGSLRWDREALTATARAVKHSKNSHASSTPIAEGDHVYAHFGYLGTACLDLEGNVVWRQTNLFYPPVHGNGGSPVIAGDHLIFNCDGQNDSFVAALNKVSGTLAWKADRNMDVERKFSFSTPLLIREGERTLAVSPGSGAVGAYDTTNGEEVWRVRYGKGFSVVPRPVARDGVVYLSSGFMKPRILAIRVGGHGDVTETHVAWNTRRGAPTTPSPLLHGTELYYVSDGGVASCVDLASGKHHWQERIGGDVSASPVLADGRIYITNEGGKTVVIAASPKFQILAENDLEERTFASAAVVGGAFFQRTESHLYRLESE
jgi:outer membrane protein assembly factor BamB